MINWDHLSLFFNNIMKKLLFCILMASLMVSCQKTTSKKVSLQGDWLGSLTVKDGHQINFLMNFDLQDQQWQMTLYNDRETIVYDQVRVEGDSLWIALAPYDAVIKAKYTSGILQGVYHKEDLNRSTPFSAVPETSRSENPTTSASINVDGSWKATFFPKPDVVDIAQADLEQVGTKVRGTVRTPTGDYRYLSGYVFGDSLRLSTFDGAHPYLFLAKYTDRGLEGQFYYENHMQTPFLWSRDETFSLDLWMQQHPMADSKLPVEFTFMDTEGETVNYPDAVWKDKVVVLQVMGSWCPNCLDETKFLIDYLENNPNPDLAVIALAVEYAPTEERAWQRLKNLKSRFSIPYPVTLAQFGTSDKVKAQTILPFIGEIKSYPTMVILDKQGKVFEVHSGFDGPATGEAHVRFKAEFDRKINELLSRD